MNESEKERLIKKDIVSIENRVRHAFNQGYEMGLKENKKQSGDAISRQAAIDALGEEPPVWYDGEDEIAERNQWKRDVEAIKALPSVQPKIKTGHWIDIMVGDMQAQACDQCKTFYPLAYTGGGHRFCPNCGAKMIEPQESEEQE